MKGWLIAALALLATAAAPVPLVTTSTEPMIVESVAFDASNHMLVGSVHGAGVYRLRANGALERWSAPGDTEGVFGIVADRARNVLWTASSGGAYGGDATARPALVKFNLRTRKRIAVYPGGPDAKSFGDIALGPDGAVYVSDSGNGDVLKLAPGASALTRVTRLDSHPSPQGLAVSPDNRVLVFSNYVEGFHRVDLRTGARTRIAGPEGIDIRGVDGVVARGDTLVLVRNAVAPARVIAITLDEDWKTVVGAEVLAEGGALEEPTGGVMRGGEFVFVARSQWTDFGGDGAPKPEIGPAIVSRLRIPAALAPVPETRSGG